LSEYEVTYLVGGVGLGLVIASFLYALGGRHNKLWRRLGSALVLSLTVIIATIFKSLWDIRLLIIFPLLFIGFSVGYGAEHLSFKLLRRTIYALGVSLSGGIFIWILGSKALFILIPHIGVGLWSVYLGVKNPIDAPAEEFFVCLLLNAGLCMYPFLA